MANRLAGGEESSGLDGLRYFGESGVTSLQRSGDGRISVRLASLHTRQEEELTGVDMVIAAVGYRPDTSITQELQIHYCYARSPVNTPITILTILLVRVP